jgi:hypothetical protein
MPMSWFARIYAMSLSVLLVMSAPAQAQVSLLPSDVQQVLATVGPQWGKALGQNIETTIAAFQPLLKAAPKDGVTVSRNIAMARTQSRCSTSISRRAEPPPRW